MLNNAYAVALRRALPSILLLAIVGWLLVFIAGEIPKGYGEIATPLVTGFGFVCLGVAAGKLMYALIDPYTDSLELYKAVTGDKNIAAGLQAIARAIILAVVIIMTCTASRADELAPPPQALPYLPILVQEQRTYWPDLGTPSFLAAQVEQETGPCPRMKSCWNPLAQLKTSREQGVGLGQLTRAYTMFGTLRFDAMGELKAQYPKELHDLTWEHWQDPRLQLRAIVLKEHGTCNRIYSAKTPADFMAFCDSAYNGGLGGLNNDRLSCKGKANCDPNVWFGNVELSSLKSKTVLPGYGGQSPYSINRTHVHNVMLLFRPKYEKIDQKV